MAFTKKVNLFNLITGKGFDGDIFTIEEFREMCEDGSLIDYDGFGHPINGDGYEDPAWCIIPSRREELPASVTHIEWFNK